MMSDAQSIFEALTPAQAGPSKTKMSCQIQRGMEGMEGLEGEQSIGVQVECRCLANATI
jgi:hypothetical protein